MLEDAHEKKLKLKKYLQLFAMMYQREVISPH